MYAPRDHRPVAPFQQTITDNHLPARDSDSITRAGLDLYLMGAAAFQYLHAGSALGIFEFLRKNPGARASAMQDHTSLSDLSLNCLLFGLEALKLIRKETEYYWNCTVIDVLFETAEWSDFQSLIDFEGQIVYPCLSDFVQSLQEGKNVGLNRIGGPGKTLYVKMISNPSLQKIFYNYMGRWTRRAAPHLLQHLAIRPAARILDVGGGDGAIAVAIAERYRDSTVKVLDLPQVRGFTDNSLHVSDISSRISFIAGDIFDSPYPEQQDHVLLAHQLVIWSPSKNRELLRKSFDALRPGGSVIIFSSISDSGYAGPLFAALDSAYFISVAAGNAMIYSFDDYEEWLSECGFTDITSVRCDSWTPHGICVGTKPVSS